MPNIENIKKYKNIHMIGIGGVSMSGIAAILTNWGFTVTGSDWAESESTEKLNSLGIKVTIGHNINDVAKSDVVVYSAAIKQDDPEMLEAQRLNIPTIERADFLGELTRCFKDTICISGTHGKTTTTSMISLCFLEALQDPSIQVGAFLNVLDGNYKVGNSEHFIIEACEYVESFLKFSPKAEIILNIDNDHLDYFKTFENIKNAFVKYTKLLPDDGLLIINGDDINCLDLPQYTNANVLTYGINNKNSHFYGKNILFDNDGLPEFEVYKNNKFFTKIKLSVPGKHNVLNALSCIALCDYYGIDKKNIQNALKKFTGAHRRFEFKGKLNGASIYDDYGHHPTEIIATSTSVNEKKHNKSWVVFQPHTYSRTKNLLDDFANALLNFDNIIVLDIYAAREANTYNISSKDLVDKIVSLGKNAKYIPDFNECVSLLKDNVKENDIVLTLGAGTVTQIGPMLLNN
ncbi:MAG: UDP-N-acetylmuramate--L-alanine ligase [Clostridia bacterium]|jgi:UDP-N-acetylmuramate--alanine ligase|nr:UDP-N-acetylmuramate--L-alanine ligase [Clostridia bacterium]